MTTEQVNTIDKKGKVYEIYNTNNKVIIYLMERFMERIEGYLSDIDAKTRFGLDIGCGEGHMIDRMHKKGLIGKQVAIDLDEERVNTAKELFPIDEIDYVVGDIYNLDLGDNKFDYVVATEIFEHLPEPELAMKNLIAYCKPGAHFIVSVPFEPYFHWGNIARGKHLHRWGKTPAHLNFWNHAEFVDFLEQFFVVEKESTFASFPWMVYLCKVK